MASGVFSSLRSFSSILIKTTNVTVKSNGKNLQSIQHILPALTATSPSVRYSSFRSSNPVEPIDEYPKVEVVINPPEWKYVERILRKPTVPEPQPKSQYPSGWWPQTNINHPYFVERTKNHMVPAYLEITFRGHRYVTVLKKIKGDIWLLEKELREYIERRVGKKIGSRVNELSGQIRYKGDYVTIVQDFLKAKGL